MDGLAAERRERDEQVKLPEGTREGFDDGRNANRSLILPEWRNGKRRRLKISRPGRKGGHEGSNPSSGTRVPAAACQRRVVLSEPTRRAKHD